MNGLKVIVGTEKRSYKPTVYDYLNAMGNLISRQGKEDEKEISKKYVLLMTKVSTFESKKEMSYEDLQDKLSGMLMLTDMMAELTPTEFMQLFPILKEYDGEKWGMKDYFSTMEYVRRFHMNRPIGKEYILDFLMEYYNEDIMKFEVRMLSVISDIRKLKGDMGVIEEFLSENGIPSYSFHEKEGIMINRRTGEVIKVSKPKKRLPKYMKVVEGSV